ncbi:hypothetical protein OIK40_11075 [Erythrobacter sp. sf7]|uniref:Uncharacterized protein n=1 Tax=Erythrobacter fulvus TaxID=2987523 RepID=A0ABT5JQY4_9SPHN|nr:hypothetical protein [Erythrobacter fulvus]MDC8755180.1 hypothetical protein [Erythrobacter fulvus]
MSFALEIASPLVSANAVPEAIFMRIWLADWADTLVGAARPQKAATAIAEMARLANRITFPRYLWWDVSCANRQANLSLTTEKS